MQCQGHPSLDVTYVRIFPKLATLAEGAQLLDHVTEVVVAIVYLFNLF